MNNYQLTVQSDDYKYTEEANLKKFEKELLFPDLREIVNSLIGINSQQQEIALNELRRLLKYNLSCFELAFSRCYEKTAQLMQSYHNYLAKTSLLLITEIFAKDNIEEEDISKWIPFILPPVIERASVNQTTIFTDLTNKALKNFSENILTQVSATCLLELIILKQDNQRYCETCFNILEALFANFDIIELQFKLEWDCIFKDMGKIFSTERDTHFFEFSIQKSLKVVVERLTQEEFERILNNNLTTPEQRNFIKDIVSKEFTKDGF